jgi:hypothetical protein
MANIAPKVRGSRVLNQVATQIKNIALFYAPKKTGNLKRKLNQANRPSNMIRIINGATKSNISVSLDIAPTGAEYGKYWNSPNVSRTVREGKTKNVPRSIDYGKQALDDPQVKRELAKFFEEFAADYTKAILKELKSK